MRRGLFRMSLLSAFTSTVFLRLLLLLASHKSPETMAQVTSTARLSATAVVAAAAAAEAAYVTVQPRSSEAAVSPVAEAGRPFTPAGGVSDADTAHLRRLRDAACSALERITRRKDSVQQRLRAAAVLLQAGEVVATSSASDSAAKYVAAGAGPAGDNQAAASVDAALRPFHARLDRSEQLIYLAIGWLEEALQGQSSDAQTLLASVERRLKALRAAAYEEEEEYQRLVHEQKERKHQNTSHHAGSILERVLSEAAQAADHIEDNLELKLASFRALASVAGHREQIGTANIRTVLVLDDGIDVSRRLRRSSLSSRSSRVRLLDSSGNHFAMTRPRDLTTSGEDSTLLRDLIYLLVAAALFGFVCSLLHVSHVFGYILAGVILGPSMADVLTSLVQIETLGELGAFMMMFSAGLDFSPDKMSQVSGVAAPSSLCLTTIIVAGGVIVGALLNASLAESAFVAICLSMTSTSLVMRYVSASRSAEHAAATAGAQELHDTGVVTAGARHYGPTLSGILVLQDALMGFVIGFLPALESSEADDDGGGSSSAAVRMSVVLFEFGILLFAVIAISAVARRLHVAYARHLTTESAILFASGLPFIVLLVMHSLDLSMELGCFLAGVAVNFIDTTLASNMDRLLLPVKNTLSCIFFVTAGLQVFPSFVFLELTSLVMVTLTIILCKFLVAVFVLQRWLPPSLRSCKYVMAAGLAQGSEFSFVLSSRARRLQLISREVYLLVTSASTLTLLLAPVAWHAVAWRVSRRKTPSEAS